MKGEYLDFKATESLISSRLKTLVGDSTNIFPHIVSGGGWETTIVIINMSPQPIPFVQRFFDESGVPVNLTYRSSAADGKVIQNSVAAGLLQPNQILTLTLFDSGAPLQVSWSALDYDATLGRLGAYEILRQRGVSAARPDFEALVPLSSSDDYRFYLAVDNAEDFSTAIALVNPASNVSARVSLTFYDNLGNAVLQDVIALAPSCHTAFSIPDKYPVLKGRVGTLYVRSNTSRLSGFGLRFNPRGAFSTVPIMNWEGMFR